MIDADRIHYWLAYRVWCLLRGHRWSRVCLRPNNGPSRFCHRCGKWKAVRDAQGSYKTVVDVMFWTSVVSAIFSLGFLAGIVSCRCFLGQC